jgi:hypothetical protein
VEERRVGVAGRRVGVAGPKGGGGAADVTVVRWKQSRHCTHLIDQRDDYMAAWTAFMRLSK